MGGTASKPIDAHETKVSSLAFNSKTKLLYSGGADGLIKSWTSTGGSLTLKSVVIDLNAATKFKPGILSIDFHPKDDTMLVGTVASEIYEVKGSTAKLMLNGHFEGELWGAATAPNGTRFVTSGDDKTIRIWDFVSHEQKAVFGPMKDLVRAVDWSNDGKLIVAGDKNGIIYLFDAKDLK